MLQATSAIAGGIVGLVIALIACAVILPRVLERQKAFLGSGRNLPLVGQDAAALARYTTFGYRYVMPVVFSIVFAVAGYHAAGGRIGV